MRSLVLALAVMLAGSCASASGERETPAHAVAQLMISALTPVEQRRPGYAWAAVEARVAPPVRWRGAMFAPEYMEGTGLRRDGWLEGRGWEFDVIVEGSHAEVRRFGIDVNDAVPDEALLAELRTAGAEVLGAGDDETAMFYYVTVPGRETAKLELRRTCTPYGSRQARHCRSIMTWEYEPALAEQP